MNPSPRGKKNTKGHDRETGREVQIDRGVYVVKGAAPKAGTKLTPERIAEDFRVLNRRARPARST